jgi:arginase
MMTTLNESGSLRPVRIIGAPMDLGAGRRGVDMGPSAIRIAGLSRRLLEMGVDVEDVGNIEVKIAEELSFGKKKHMYLDEISQACVKLAQRVRETLDSGKKPLVLGGDHSIAVGSVSGAASYCRRQKGELGLIWVDAHTDLNTPETSPSGNVHGMPLAALLGLGPKRLTEIEGFSPKVRFDRSIVIGARSIDEQERKAIQKTGLRVVTMKELDMRGLTAVLEEALKIASDGTLGFHCSFDLDVVDPQIAPGVGTPVRGGMTYRESHLAMEMIFDSRRCISLEMVEVNPVLDSGNVTGILAAELICSALGKKIL